MLSKVLPYYVLGLVSLLLCVAISVFVLRVPYRGSLAALLATGTLFLGSALGMGLLISTVTRNQFNAAMAALNAAFLPALILSGFIYEIRSMPLVIRAVTYLVPARYFVTTLKALFLKGAGLGIIANQMLFMAIFATIVYLLAVRKLKRQKVD